MNRDVLIEYIKEKYDCEPEYLWARFPNYAVFRHKDNSKWFGIIMDVPVEKLGLIGNGRVDILNVKVKNTLLVDLFLQKEGYLKAYHMNKENWLSILLDGIVPEDEILEMLDDSFEATV